MSNAQGYRPDFKEVKKLIDSVIRLDDAACSIITEQELQLDSVKKACGIYRIEARLVPCGDGLSFVPTQAGRYDRS